MLLMAFSPSLVSATTQIPDEIVIDGKTRALISEPEPFVRYLKDSGQHAKLQPYLNGSICSASWRGFRAYWRIEDARLLLIKLLANPCDRQPKEVPLTVFFPDDSAPVFAGWFSGELLVPLGSRLRDLYLFEHYLLITVERGLVINRREFRGRPLFSGRPQ
jgi:hypothetical protein